MAFLHFPKLSYTFGKLSYMTPTLWKCNYLIINVGLFKVEKTRKNTWWQKTIKKKAC